MDGLTVVLVAGLAVALLRPSSSSLLFRHCFFFCFLCSLCQQLFFPLYSSFNGGAGGREWLG
jgi:hypothetical protein